ncbi:hypothetical protein N7510_000099 [Penicillium lagena]|uniref:uncharacterized protein n=1 Tax=Penicillium lagena TaxID=94218 RepID=UPI00254227F5|nr:uncharacterized protein N7510_000099 [Penicillium lagena]KAJ5623790.1 hypothetical protein N7510_000099 [Penicillium lagena]
MMAHTALIYLCNVPNSLPWEINKQRIMPTYEEEALAAALEIANLTRSLDEFGIFKARLAYQFLLWISR